MKCKPRKEDAEMKNYDVIIIGAGPGGIFAAYELMQHQPDMKVAVNSAEDVLCLWKSAVRLRNIRSPPEKRF